MNFHLGKPILVMILIAAISSVAVALRPAQKKADLTIWVFAPSHEKTFRPLVEQFAREHHVTINLNLLNARAEILRLGQLFMRDLHDPETPDLVEMEIGLVGRFFRPPVDQIGFLPLDGYLDRSGWRDRLVQQRLAPWQKHGVTFGIPNDVHPCTITYRQDLFTEAGINLPDAKTWYQFQDACVHFEQYWRARGYKTRHALELPESSSDFLQTILLQRGINPIDSDNQVHLEDPRVADTLAWYATMVTGAKKCTGESPQGEGSLTRDLTQGNLCAFITPDWELTYLKMYGQSVSGKMRMMPMPVFEPSDTPTSTRGGTMMGITKACPNPDLAWKLLEFLYLSRQGLEGRQEVSDILPPVRDYWSDPFYNKPDPFLGGQRGGALFVKLAGQIPRRYVTPMSSLATLALNDAQIKAVHYVNEHGDDMPGLRAACRGWLIEASKDLKLRIDQMELKQ
jgi:ABC-type glycerol-3-phosphate transport system substrate-binding protein